MEIINMTNDQKLFICTLFLLSLVGFIIGLALNNPLFVVIGLVLVFVDYFGSVMISK